MNAFDNAPFEPHASIATQAQIPSASPSYQFPIPGAYQSQVPDASPYNPHSPLMSSSRYSFIQSPKNFYGSHSTYHQQGSGEPNPDVYPPLLPFTLCFISGNIRVCIGCRNNYPKAPKPPHDLCIRHEESSPNTSVPLSKFGNVYYHCKKECIWMRCPTFTSSDLFIPPNMQLSSAHTECLTSVFGIIL